MIVEYSLGDVRITLVNDAFIKLDGNSGFYPAKRPEWRPGTNTDDQGFLRMAVRCMLVQEPDGISLVDTGFGDEGEEERTKGIVPLLADIGVKPDLVSKVIITHAHGDHFWGNTKFKKGVWEPVFPYAEYIIQKADLDMICRTEPDWAWSREKDLESRRTIAGRAASENWILIAGHDLDQPLFRLEETSSKEQLETGATSPQTESASSYKAIPVEL